MDPTNAALQAAKSETAKIAELRVSLEGKELNNEAQSLLATAQHLAASVDARRAQSAGQGEGFARVTDSECRRLEEVLKRLEEVTAA